jgi:hypothetical protein
MKIPMDRDERLKLRRLSRRASASHAVVPEAAATGGRRVSKLSDYVRVQLLSDSVRSFAVCGAPTRLVMQVRRLKSFPLSQQRMR